MKTGEYTSWSMPVNYALMLWQSGQWTSQWTLTDNGLMIFSLKNISQVVKMPVVCWTQLGKKLQTVEQLFVKDIGRKFAWIMQNIGFEYKTFVVVALKLIDTEAICSSFWATRKQWRNARRTVWNLTFTCELVAFPTGCYFQFSRASQCPFIIQWIIMAVDLLFAPHLHT